MSQPTIWFMATAGQTAFVLPSAPSAIVALYWNGILQNPSSYSISGSTVNVTFSPGLNDQITITYIASPGPYAGNPIDLTNVANVRNRAEVSSTNDDIDIQAAITAFSKWLLDWSGLATLNSIASLAETYDGNGNQRMFLRSYPILSLLSVTMNGCGIPLSGGPTAWGAYIDQSKKSIGLRGGVGQFSMFPYPTFLGAAYSGMRGRRGPVFYQGQQNIQVSYTAGYAPQLVTNDLEVIESNTLSLAAGPWVSDAGVSYYPSLIPLVSVQSSPAVGHYAVSNGLYVFNSADNGNEVALSYNVNAAPADLEYAVRCIVAINYKRKSWQDQKSRAVMTQGGGSATTTYQSWDFPPEWWNVLLLYKREAII